MTQGIIKPPPKVPGQTMGFALILFVITTALFFLTLYPSHRSAERKDKRILSLESEIQKQEILSPLFQALLSNRPDLGSLDLPPILRAPLDRREIINLSGTFSRIAEKSGLTPEKAIPDIETLKGEENLLKVDLFLSGDFFDFRSFLLLLNRLPFMERVEEIRIMATPETIRFSLKVWLTLEKTL